MRIVASILTHGRGRWAAGVVLLVAVGGHMLLSEPTLRMIRQPGFDLYQTMFPRQVDRIPAAILAIDEDSLDEFGQWPWPRTLLSKLIQGAFDRGALAVGLDMLLAEPGRASPSWIAQNYPDIDPELRERLAQLPSTDRLLSEAIARLPVVVGRAGVHVGGREPSPEQPATPVSEEGAIAVSALPEFPRHVINLPVIEAAAAGFGYLNASEERDGVVRRAQVLISVGGTVRPGLPAELLRVAIGANWLGVIGGPAGVSAIVLGETAIPIEPDGTMRLHFSHSDPRRYVRAKDVLSGAAPGDAFRNQVVLIGATALGLGDVVTTPLGERMPGVEVHAQTIEQMLSDERLQRPAFVRNVEVLVLLVAGVALILFMPMLGQAAAALAFLTLAAVLFGGGVAAFVHARWLLDPVYPLAGTTAVFAAMMSSMLTASVRDRRALQGELEREKLSAARIAGELAAAREIQLGTLPDTTRIDRLPPGIDLYAVLEPAREVGGDLYDAFMLDGDRLFFLVGDVTGKGVPAALFMALSKAMCKSAALRPHDALDAVIETANLEISRENPASMFVTVFAGVFDARTGAVEFCNAGHEDPHILGADGTVRTLESDGGPPLCVLDDFPYPLERVTLAPGETMVLSTDGLTEAQAPDGALFGRVRLEALLAAHASRPARAVVDAVRDAVRSFEAGGEPGDDLTVMAIRYIPGQAGPEGTDSDDVSGR